MTDNSHQFKITKTNIRGGNGRKSVCFGQVCYSTTEQTWGHSTQTKVTFVVVRPLGFGLRLDGNNRVSLRLNVLN